MLRSRSRRRWPLDCGSARAAGRAGLWRNEAEARTKVKALALRVDRGPARTRRTAAARDRGSSSKRHEPLARDTSAPRVSQPCCGSAGPSNGKPDRIAYIAAIRLARFRLRISRPRRNRPSHAGANCQAHRARRPELNARARRHRPARCRSAAAAPARRRSSGRSTACRRRAPPGRGSAAAPGRAAGRRRGTRWR